MLLIPRNAMKGEFSPLNPKLNLIVTILHIYQYRSIYELISKHWDTGGFMIFNDLPYTNNDHPSMKLHDLLAENVINKLKKDYEN